jgi:hypothetical protein
MIGLGDRLARCVLITSSIRITAIGSEGLNAVTVGPQGLVFNTDRRETLMKRTTLFYLLSALFLLATGCGGNQAACEDYVDSVNELECVNQKLDAEDECPDELDDDECDMEDYYGCLADNTTCLDGQLQSPAAGECTLDCE